MKTFLTLCTCAMVTAGIYGFADMARDVNNGTMIRYDRGEAPVSVTATMLRSGTHYAINVKDIRKAPAHFNFKVPVGVTMNKPAEPVTFDFTKFTESYSRAIVPTAYYTPLTAESVPETDISTTLLTTGITDAPEIKKPEKAPVTKAPAAADTVSAQPEIVATTEVKTDSTVQLDVPKEEFDYRDFSRGSPRKYKKKKH